MDGEQRPPVKVTADGAERRAGTAMNGLEQLIGHIAAEDREKADRIRTEARQKAEAIRAQAKKQADEQCAEILRHAEAERQNKKERGAASAALKKRQVLLQARQTLVSETIEAAKRRVLELPDAAYFDLLLQLFAKHAPAGEAAELYLNARDLERLTEDVRARFAACSEQQGGHLQISEKPAAIDGGFVLKCGDIEENCSMEALFAGNIEQMQDEACRILFAAAQEGAGA